MCRESAEMGDGCRCPSGRMRGFVQPCLLLELAKRPSHGYELMELLGREDDEPAPDPGSLYRTLRMFEEDGLVRSTWETQGSGPARRVYELTAQGMEYLHAWVASLRGTRARLDRFLDEYAALMKGEKGDANHVHTLSSST